MWILLNFNPRKIHFLDSFSFISFFAHKNGIKRCGSFLRIFHKYETFIGRFPPTQTPTQNLKIWFPMSSSQEIGLGLVSLEMIFQALQSELFRFKFHSLGSKIQKNGIQPNNGRRWTIFSSLTFVETSCGIFMEFLWILNVYFSW